MRALLDREKGEGGPWNLKHAPGGLVDIEFAAQALQLVHAAKHPEILSTATVPALDHAREAGLLDAEAWRTFRAGARLQQDLTQALRLATEKPFDPDEAGEGLKRLLARTAEAPDFAVLTATLEGLQKEVRAAFERVLAGLR